MIFLFFSAFLSLNKDMTWGLSMLIDVFNTFYRTNHGKVLNGIIPTILFHKVFVLDSCVTFSL